MLREVAAAAAAAGPERGSAPRWVGDGVPGLAWLCALHPLPPQRGGGSQRRRFPRPGGCRVAPGNSSHLAYVSLGSTHQ